MLSCCMLPYCHVVTLHATILPCYFAAMPQCFFLTCCHTVLLPCCHTTTTIQIVYWFFGLWSIKIYVQTYFTSTSMVDIRLVGPTAPAPFVLAAGLFETAARLRNTPVAATGSSTVSPREAISAVRSGTAPVWGARAVGTATNCTAMLSASCRQLPFYPFTILAWHTAMPECLLPCCHAAMLPYLIVTYGQRSCCSVMRSCCQNCQL